ncbi:Na+/H+ antiporter NhaA [soil metagenome]
MSTTRPPQDDQNAEYEFLPHTDAELVEGPDPAARLTPSFADSGHVAARKLVQPVQHFLHLETSGGIVLVLAAVLALVLANSPLREAYEAVIDHHIVLDFGFLTLDEPLELWINDLLMAVFFFVAGLEIKRELVHGDLRDPKTAALPIAAALGGMVVPAALFFAINAGGEGAAGWGIPMATDIAFAVGVLALVGTRAPASLKIFLLTLAIIDDIGAILVIAVVYTTSLNAIWLAVAAGVVLIVLALQRLKVNSSIPYVVLAGLLWLAVFESGVHATIAGVVMGLLTPASPRHPPEAVTGTIHYRLRQLRARPADGRADESEQNELKSVADLALGGVSPLRVWQHRLHPWSAFVILPLFALANAGVSLQGFAPGDLFTEALPLGVIAGLVIGKPVGVMGAAFLATKSGLAKLPRGVGWLELGGVGLLAGVGFTVSIFISGLAFTDDALVESAKVGILAASVAAGILGFAALAARKTTD